MKDIYTQQYLKNIIHLDQLYKYQKYENIINYIKNSDKKNLIRQIKYSIPETTFDIININYNDKFIGNIYGDDKEITICVCLIEYKSNSIGVNKYLYDQYQDDSFKKYVFLTYNKTTDNYSYWCGANTIVNFDEIFPPLIDKLEISDLINVLTLTDLK